MYNRRFSGFVIHLDTHTHTHTILSRAPPGGGLRVRGGDGCGGVFGLGLPLPPGAGYPLAPLPPRLAPVAALYRVTAPVCRGTPRASPPASLRFPVDPRGPPRCGRAAAPAFGAPPFLGCLPLEPDRGVSSGWRRGGWPDHGLAPPWSGTSWAAGLFGPVVRADCFAHGALLGASMARFWPSAPLHRRAFAADRPRVLGTVAHGSAGGGVRRISGSAIAGPPPAGLRGPFEEAAAASESVAVELVAVERAAHPGRARGVSGGRGWSLVPVAR